MHKKFLIVILLCVTSFTVQAEIVVVSSRGLNSATLSDNAVRQLFSGQLKVIKGITLQALDLPAGNTYRDDFYRQLMGRSPEQMRAYWTRLIFTGQGKPPREVTSAQELITLLGSGNYIGYLPVDALTSQLQVLYRLE